MSKKQRKGQREARGARELEAPAVAAEAKYPVLCLRHLQPGYGVEEMTESQRSEFLKKWAKRSSIPWDEITAKHGRHGLGTEFIPKSQILCDIPEQFKKDRYLAMRHEGNLPFVGFRADAVFHVLWIEAQFNELYSHDGKNRR